MLRLGLQRDGVFCEPVGKFLFAEGAVGEVEEGEIFFFRWRDDLQAIYAQEALRDHQRSAFIPVNEGMVASNSEGVGCREPAKADGIAVGEDIAGLGEC